jgi:thiamine kinase-like enzyme
MSTLLSPFIPANRIDAVEKAMIQTFGRSEAQKISLLSGGLSGASVCKIVVEGQTYLLKLFDPQAAMAAPPSIYQQLVADAGIAPPLHYHNELTGVSISGFIESSQIFFLPPEKIIQELALSIKAIHHIKVDGKAMDLLTLVDGVVQWLQQSDLFRQEVWDEFFIYYHSIRSIYPWNDTLKVLSHNDLNPTNTLWDGNKIWIIDWDVASINDPYVDLATAANFFVQRPGDEKLLLDIYFNGNASDIQTARFFIMRQICRLVYSREMLQRALINKPADVFHDTDGAEGSLRKVTTQLRTGKLSLQTWEGQYLYGKALFQEALGQMRSAQLAHHIACLG